MNRLAAILLALLLASPANAALRAVSTATTGGTTAVSIAKPTGVASGDIVLLFVATDVASQTCSTPTGFTAFTVNGQSSPDGQTNFAFWRRFDGSEGANITATLSAGSDGWIAHALAFSGRDASNSPVAVLTTPNTSSNASPINVALTGVTAVDGDDIAWWVSLDKTSDSPAWSFTPPTDYTEGSDTNFSWTAASLAYRENVGAGATGTLTGVATAGGGSAGFAGYVVRVPAATGGGGGTVCNPLSGRCGAAAPPLTLH